MPKKISKIVFNYLIYGWGVVFLYDHMNSIDKNLVLLGLMAQILYYEVYFLYIKNIII